MKFCANCGAQVNEGQPFCANCGAKQNQIPQINQKAEGKATKKRFKALVVCIILLVLIVLGSGAWYVFGRNTDNNNSIIIKYDAFRIEENGKWGLIDNKGNKIIKPKYDDITNMYDGLAAVKVEDKWGYINKSGEMVIKPKYDGANEFRDGLAYVNKGEEGEFIDKKGNMVISIKGDHGIFFSEGMLPIYESESGLRKVGFVDKKGNVVIEPIYDGLFGEHFQNGYVILRNSEGSYIFNTKGEKIPTEIHFEYSQNGEPHYGFSCGVAAVPFNSETSGYIDTKGKLVIKNVAGCTFNEGLAPAVKDSKWGFIDTNGEFVIEPQFIIAETFSEGLALVGLKGNYGYIDKTGEVIIELEKGVKGGLFSNGVAEVQVVENGNASWGYIDKDGNYLWKSKK
jgi:hypothetical protein